MVGAALVRAALVLAAILLVATPVDAQITRHPTGVNVNATDATSALVTFGNLDGYVADEALWCGELIDAAPEIGNRCAPGTIFGSLPLAFDLSRTSGVDGFTDVMSIPPSVARRAYQAAYDGDNSAFFYVRRFVDPTGARPAQYVAVTCRLTGGGARVPFSLLDVRVGFASDDAVLSLRPGAELPPIRARIAYNGTGRLAGRWEVVLPGEEPPTADDLLTEASLPAELRGTQRRYTEIERFNVFLAPGRDFVLEGPDPARLPTDRTGMYLLLLRIEATDDKEGDSDLAAAGAGSGIVRGGAVAGFPIPPLRYYVGSGGDAMALADEAGFRPLLPAPGEPLDPGEPSTFAWTAHPGAVVYRLTVRAAAGPRLLSALLEADEREYVAPPWLTDRADGTIAWEVEALGPEGEVRGRTGWGYGEVGRSEP